MHTHHQAIGLDIGGTKLLAALVDWVTDDKGNLVPFVDGGQTVSVTGTIRQATPTTPDDFAKTVQAMVAELQAKSDTPLPVGIASAGMIQPTTNAILGATGNLPALQGVASFNEILPEVAALYALNDANAAAYGEYGVLSVAEKTDYSHVLMITLGTGIGGGFVINGRIFSGENGGAMEVGHIALDPRSSRQCTCGKIGCWEAYASGTGLHSTLLKTLADEGHQHPDEGTLLAKSKAGEAVTTFDLMAAVARGNDTVANEVITTWHNHLAQGLAAVVTVLNPGLIILGGGLGNAVDIPNLQALLGERILQPVPTMRTAQLENTAGLVGAALLAAEQHPTSTTSSQAVIAGASVG